LYAPSFPTRRSSDLKVNNVSSICLDLLKLNIDSVYINHQTQNYHYNDTILKVNFGLSYNIGDTVQLYVKYQGTPQVDASGWGGRSEEHTSELQSREN